jgi:hypothetical protein
MLLQGNWMLTLFAFLESGYGVVIFFVTIVAIILSLGLRATINSIKISYTAVVFCIIIPSIILITYGIGSFDAEFLFIIPLWTEKVADNTVALIGGILILVYSLPVIAKYYHQPDMVSVKIGSYPYIIGIYAAICIICVTAWGDRTTPQLILILTGVIIAAIGSLRKNALVGSIAATVILTAVIGFGIGILVDTISGWAITLGSAAVSMILIVRRSITAPISAIDYCKNNPDDDRCRLLLLDNPQESIP